MRTTFFRGIQTKLVGLYLMLTIASLAALTALFYQTTGKIISSTIRSHLQSIAESRTELISRWMEEREHDVEVLAKNTTVKRDVAALVNTSATDSSELRRELAVLLRLVRDQYQAYHELVVFDREGPILVTTKDASSPSEIHDATILQSTREGRPHVSDLDRSGDGNPLSINISAPIKTDNGEVIGGILARVNLDIINQMTDSMELMESGEAYLVDRRGVFVTHRDRRRVFRDNIAEVVGVKDVISGHNGVGEYVDYRGIAVLGGYQWLPRWQWGLLAEVDRSEAFEPLFSARRFLVFIALLVAAAVLFGTFLIARRIVRPLRELTVAVQAMASGSLNQHLPIAGGDEIAYLSESFNQMADSVSQAQTKLENRVRQATMELEEKNERLEKTNQELFAANKKLEQQTAMLMHSAKLAAMGEMAAGFAHEINNPLTTLKNLVQLSKEGPHDIRSQDLEVLSEEVDRVSRLVLSFLNYAKPHEASVASVCVGEVVHKAIDLVNSQLPDKSIKIEAKVDRTVPEIQGDGEQIGQVIVNLLLNAVQASTSGCKVQAFVKTAYSDSPTTPTSIQFGVTDQGRGIESEHRPKLFGPFFTTKENGFGLGLAVSQRIVQDHGGEISFTSEPDEATTFVVSIPVERGARDESDSNR